MTGITPPHKAMEEIWKDVVGFEGTHEVSSEGRVRSRPFMMRHWSGKVIPQSERIVKQSRHSGGYCVVALRDGKKHYVHRLVASAFIGESNEKQDVNHINGVKSDNRVENLEYCDRLHNVRHAIRTGLQDNSGERNGRAKHKAERVAAACRLALGGMSYAEASRKSGVCQETIRLAVAGKRWKGVLESAK